MSCGCNNPRGSFAPEQDTWTRQSSLSMQNWDPYPDLQDPKNCYENFGNYAGANMRWDSFTPNLNRSVVISGSREKFIQDMRCCGATPYNNLNQTWAPQKNYML